MLSKETNPIIIAGMHCSGTSLLAELLRELGVHIGDSLDPHLESVVYQELNEWLLGLAHISWDRPEGVSTLFADEIFSEVVSEIKERISEPNWLKRYAAKFKSIARGDLAWGWKDPRSTLTMPIWSKVYPQARCVFIRRNGVDVAASLSKRERGHLGELDKVFSDSGYQKFVSFRCLSLEESFSLWEEYHQIFEMNIASLPELPVYQLSYESLLENPITELRGLVKFLGLAMPDEASLENIASRVDKTRSNRYLLDPDLKTFYETKQHSKVMQQGGYLK